MLWPIFFSLPHRNVLTCVDSEIWRNSLHNIYLSTITGDDLIKYVVNFPNQFTADGDGIQSFFFTFPLKIIINLSIFLCGYLIDGSEAPIEVIYILFPITDLYSNIAFSQGSLELCIWRHLNVFIVHQWCLHDGFIHHEFLAPLNWMNLYLCT